MQNSSDLAEHWYVVAKVFWMVARWQVAKINSKVTNLKSIILPFKRKQ